MEKKIIVITGATNGIGKATATKLARQGHTLILHGRNEQKTKACVEEIKQVTGNEDVSYVLADMLKLDTVKRMADEIKQKVDHIDVLLNNAGAQFGEEREVTPEGHEKTMTVNVMAPTLLSLELLPLLNKSKDGRIATTSSASYAMGGKVIADGIELERNYSYTKVYGRSKLYVIWMMKGVEKVIKEKGYHVSVNITHPGATISGLGNDAKKGCIVKLIFGVWFLLAPLTMNSMEKAIKGNLYCATAENLDSNTNVYYGPKGKEKLNLVKFDTDKNQPIIWDYFHNIIQQYE